jgi:arabinofuranan 3-O-arabinosyltransferase
VTSTTTAPTARDAAEPPGRLVHWGSGLLRRLRGSNPGTWLLAAICYLPLLLTAPGKIGADTKQYLYLDIDRMLSRAPYMWDSHVGMGTVTHQNIGYLLPMGPWYWFFDHIGVPIWVAERLWTGTLLFAAAAGVQYLLRTFGWGRRAMFIAALAYGLSPYVLEYEARISAILMPWAGLPWLLGAVIRGLRQVTDPTTGRLARWRYPAVFASIVALIGAVNATSLIYVLLAPVLWLPFAIWGYHEVRFRTALNFAAKTILLVVLANLWWISGLATQAGFGLDVLAYTETVKTVASASQASEVLRGLGNWYFYGRDGIAAWVEPANEYTGNLVLMAVSFAIPSLALLGAACVRWGYRAYFVTLVAVGTTIAVGVYPFTDPSPLGGLFKSFATASTAGLALRSMPRAVPLVALGLAVFLGGGVDAFGRWWSARSAQRVRTHRLARWTPAIAAGVVLVLIGANMAPLWQGQFVDPNLERSETLPAYMKQMAAYLNASGSSTRVLELPGADFSQYRWGATLDPVPPGLMDRPFVSRELIPYGEPASADLLRAIDRRLQEGVFETSALPSLAAMMSVGDIELRSDLQYERFRTPRPLTTWELFGSGKTPGLDTAKQFGPKVAETPEIPLTDETTLAQGPNLAKPPAVAVFGVPRTESIVRAESTDRPLVVAGNAEGLVDAAAAGLLSDSGVILLSASLTPAEIQQALGQNAVLLVTDSNRKRAERWGTVRENYGYVETATGKPLRTDVTDARLPVFPTETASDQTVAQYRGVANVQATDYGNPVSYAPADRPVHAVDGDLTTAWRVGAFSDVRGERLQITALQPTTTDHLTLTQPLTGPRNRWITKVTLTFDGGHPMTVNLTDASRTNAGQRINFSSRKFTRLDVKIDDTNLGVQAQYNGASGVGFAEVSIPGVQADEVLRLPTDLLNAAGAQSLRHELLLQMARDRANPAEPFKDDTEKSMARAFTLPTARAFALTGTARLSADASDSLLDQAVGRPTSGVVTATSSARLPGDVAARAASAFDGNLATIWSPPFQTPNSWLQVSSPTAVTTSSLDLDVVADGQHSVPTKIRLDVDGAPARTLTLPPITDGKTVNGTKRVHLTFPAVTGKTFRIEMQGLRAETTEDYFSHGQDLLPVGIAEVGLAGLQVPTAPKALPETCRSDLITVDGTPIPVKVTGTNTTAEGRGALTVQACDSALRLSAGTHILRTAKGVNTGIDVDRLVLGSKAGGTPATVAPDGTMTTVDAATGASVDGSAGSSQVGAATTTAMNTAADAIARTAGTPTVRVNSSNATSFHLTVSGATKPFWLVLGQSLSKGWTAKINGGPSLGTPRLVDGYANGWVVQPTAATFNMTLDWTPQHRVFQALAISAVGLLLCLLLILWPGRRWRPSDPALPEMINPLTLTHAGSLNIPRAVIALIGLTVGAAIVIKPVVAPIVLALAVLGLLVPRGRALLRLGSAACLMASAVYVLQAQARYNLPSNGQWVQAFHKVATLSWLAVALLVADVVIGWARRSELPPPDTAPVDSSTP